MSAAPAARVDKVLAEMISGVRAQYGITSWENNFLADIHSRAGLSWLQEERLREIEIKVFGEDYDPHSGDLFDH